MTLNPWVEYVGTVIATATPILVGLRVVARHTKRHVVDPARAFLGRVESTCTKVDRIDSELGANGGKSLKDTVTRMDQRTRHQDARLAALIGSQPEPMFEACDQGEFLAVNRALEALTGFSREEMVGMGWVNTLHPDDRERVMVQWAHAIRDERAFLESCRLRTAAGRVILVRIAAYPMLDLIDRSVVGWHGLVDVERAA